MKSPADILTIVQRHFDHSWPAVVLRDDQSRWPDRIALGTVPKDLLEDDFPAVQRWALGWQTWAADHPVTLETKVRLVHGTRQSVPSHVTVPTLFAAVELLGADARAVLDRARQRAVLLVDVAAPNSLTDTYLRHVVAMSDVDFTMLLAAVSWLTQHDPAGLTPRQVPIPGVHGKWLNTRERMLTDLSGRTTLGFADARPARVHFTYLDPAHRAAGGRRFDLHTDGDPAVLAYVPETVLITENKDTAVAFPDVAAGIAVEGSGYTGHARHVGWIRECSNVVYWGDMDADGLAIVNMYRASGLDIRTILMDVATFDEFAQFGTRVDARGDSMPTPERLALPHLTDAERSLYDRLTDPTWSGPLRVEQERIPMSRARSLLN